MTGVPLVGGSYRLDIVDGVQRWQDGRESVSWILALTLSMVDKGESLPRDGQESMSWILALTLSMVDKGEGLATEYPSWIVL